MTWMLDALCRTRPSDWWDLGDDGNRLALAICSVCPVLAICSATAGEPLGVVRAAVAYRDSGDVAALCPCGRPIPTRRDRGECFTCVPRFETPIPDRRRRGRPSAAEEHLETVADLLSQGLPVTRIAARIGVPRATVADWVRTYRLRSRVCPQVDPQTGDAA